MNREGVSYWIHGRDMPGYPASHGCIGLYDESMQKNLLTCSFNSISHRLSKTRSLLLDGKFASLLLDHALAEVRAKHAVIQAPTIVPS